MGWEIVLTSKFIDEPRCMGKRDNNNLVEVHKNGFRETLYVVKRKEIWVQVEHFCKGKLIEFPLIQALGFTWEVLWIARK
jgi:hypothetical protein